MKERIGLLLFPLLVAAGSLAQSTAPEVFSTAGGFGNSATEQISWTIGEPVIATVAAGSNSVTQGFQQPWADVTIGLEESPANGPAIAVYPNPTRHVLNVVYGGLPGRDRYELHDAGGRLVQGDRVAGPHMVLDMEKYASGMYVLRLLGPDDNILRTFKINVNQ